ncbi:hypothetical protein Acy02nite_67810 [Actinoplanes cyaneus]|uniref:Uncharacterized protein n=1 Tax=Actinoplanes cyaneus TaxID=52696 RepID=A0A919M419_9ACTN|nr:hypothetical protein Acy02nite_67810 [Actinoplanes cyaneus]
MGDPELPGDFRGGQLSAAEQGQHPQSDRVREGAQRRLAARPGILRQRHVGESMAGRVDRPTVVGEWQTARKGGILAKVTGE